MNPKNAAVLRSYLERSLTDLGLSSYLGVALADPRIEEIVALIANEVESSVLPKTMKHDVLILNNPDAFFQTEEPSDIATISYMKQRFDQFRSMRAAMVLALLGDERGVTHLGALLVTEPLNWKLMISHFLGNLTGGQIGSLTEEIPTRQQVVRWAAAIRENGFAREAVLPALRLPDYKVS